MQTQKRTPFIRIRIFFILLLVLLSSGIVIYQFNQPSPVFVAIETGQAPPSSTPSPVVKQGSKYKIVIDPGHGGKDPGAVGVSGKEEKVYALALAQKVYDLLKQESVFDPYLTRNDDTFVSLDDRAEMANELEADAFISIHGNTYSDPGVSGTETFYYSDNSKQLAAVMHKHLLAADGFKDRGVRYDQWKVLRLSEVPAILAEVGYISNKNDEATLLNKEGQARIAQAIVDGLKEYFKEKA
ncbi:MAG: N-acetylmuramoyl-L-alanine amidase [Paenibacillus sp.]|nr:N-acetylmuramoyl-L-alanine amidase [Paenibacillus sp.]